MRTARSRGTAARIMRRCRSPPRPRPYDHVLLDLDGCVWVGDEALDGAVDAVAALREAGKSVLFLTNDVRHPPEGFVRKLWRLGFQASLDEVLSVGAAVQFWLAERNTRQRVRRRLPGARRPRRRRRPADRQQHAVRDPRRRRRGRRPRRARPSTSCKIATQAVLRGAELIGATRDANFPMPDGLWPGTGAVLAAIEVASGRKADHIVGKPEPAMYEAALRPPRRGPRARRSATGSTSTWRAPAARGSTRRWSSRARRRRRRPTRPSRSPRTSRTRWARSFSRTTCGWAAERVRVAQT